MIHSLSLRVLRTEEAKRIQEQNMIYFLDLLVGTSTIDGDRTALTIDLRKLAEADSGRFLRSLLEEADSRRPSRSFPEGLP